MKGLTVRQIEINVQILRSTPRSLHPKPFHQQRRLYTLQTVLLSTEQQLQTTCAGCTMQPFAPCTLERVQQAGELEVQNELPQ